LLNKSSINGLCKGQQCPSALSETIHSLTGP
jgi:hypothetical protein